MAVSGRLRSAVPLFGKILSSESPVLCVRSAADRDFGNPSTLRALIPIYNAIIPVPSFLFHFTIIHSWCCRSILHFRWRGLRVTKNQSSLEHRLDFVEKPNCPRFY
ncbi:ATP synthase subunit O, mitochondrial [Canna indica]|uniref:ATP synthase subunit O, mitochondrial n=1 Tax=Canna indica TaxID=4628 RepID=A0AAQ3Q6X4_9LILI|nr:ATP synthase subunit O, mitochondrial [Canna indica]